MRRETESGDGQSLMDVPETQSSQSSEIAHVLFMDIAAYSTLSAGQQQRFL